VTNRIERFGEVDQKQGVRGFGLHGRVKLVIKKLDIFPNVIAHQETPLLRMQKILNRIVHAKTNTGGNNAIVRVVDRKGPGAAHVVSFVFWEEGKVSLVEGRWGGGVTPELLEHRKQDGARVDGATLVLEDPIGQKGDTIGTRGSVFGVFDLVLYAFKRRAEGGGRHDFVIVIQVVGHPYRIIGVHVPDLPPKPSRHLGHPTWVGRGVLVGCGSHRAETGFVKRETGAGRLYEVFVCEGSLSTRFGGHCVLCMVVFEKIIDAGLKFRTVDRPLRSAKASQVRMFVKKGTDVIGQGARGGGQTE
jgi:hypothetical protein